MIANKAFDYFPKVFAFRQVKSKQPFDIKRMKVTSKMTVERESTSEGPQVVWNKKWDNC